MLLQRTRSPEPTNLTEASRYRVTVARTNGVEIPEQIVAAFVRGILRAGGDTHGPRKGILITPAQPAHTEINWTRFKAFISLVIANFLSQDL
jgi:hypothetical protein